MRTFDLAVIGGGPGGYVAAIRAAQLGMSVACIEKDKALGGTCLNVGCIPSKALLDSSEHFAMASHGLAKHGVKVSGVELDLPTMLARKDKVVKALTSGIKGLLRKNKIEHITGTGTLLSPTQIQVNGAEPETIEAKRILIATGSVPVELPNLPFDGKRVVSSTEALSFPSVPNRLLVIGGGAIGLELGSVWNRLGSKVEVVEFLDRIVPGMDRQLGEQLQKILKKQGISFRLSTGATGIETIKDGVAVTVESGGKTDRIECDVVLVAVGRKPYTVGLGLESLGVAFDGRGRIVVDDHYRTNIESIYAVGDVIAGPMLAHKAMDEGAAAAERMAGQAGHVNYDAVPGVVYTWPEFAGVGITEEQARERGGYRVGTFPFIATGRARAMEETDGMVKVIADEKTDRVLGVHILGARASDLIAEATLAIEFGASSEDLARTVHAHPTLPEAIKEAALAVDGRVVHI